MVHARETQYVRSVRRGGGDGGGGGGGGVGGDGLLSRRVAGDDRLARGEVNKASSGQTHTVESSLVCDPSSPYFVASSPAPEIRARIDACGQERLVACLRWKERKSERVGGERERGCIDFRRNVSKRERRDTVRVNSLKRGDYDAKNSFGISNNCVLTERKD